MAVDAAAAVAEASPGRASHQRNYADGRRRRRSRGECLKKTGLTVSSYVVLRSSAAIYTLGRSVAPHVYLNRVFTF